jgi:hypothetical protein
MSMLGTYVAQAQEAQPESPAQLQVATQSLKLVNGQYRLTQPQSGYSISHILSDKDGVHYVIMRPHSENQPHRFYRGVIDQLLEYKVSDYSSSRTDLPQFTFRRDSHLFTIIVRPDGYRGKTWNGATVERLNDERTESLDEKPLDILWASFPGGLNIEEKLR